MQNEGFSIKATQELEILTSNCNLIVTTTPSTFPLLLAKHLKKGTHITAVGADTPYKQELDSKLFAKADIIVADSLDQCRERGNIAYALRESVISRDQIVELGALISGNSPKRTSDEQLTVADLTGLAVQDLEISKAVYEDLSIGSSVTQSLLTNSAINWNS